jgi:ureidoglycolate hydrolase
MEVVTIKVQPMTEESFRPFGELLSAKARPPDFRGITSDGWKTAFESDGATSLMLLRSRYEGFRFTRLERHFGVTQTFIPVGQVPAVVAVAAPTDPYDKEAIPALQEVRGFLIDGTVGYVLKRGTWHSLDRYPLAPPGSEIVIITSRETQVELETVDPAGWRLTQAVDYAERFGVTFEFAL